MYAISVVIFSVVLSVGSQDSGTHQFSVSFKSSDGQHKVKVVADVKENDASIFHGTDLHSIWDFTSGYSGFKLGEECFVEKITDFQDMAHLLRSFGEDGRRKSLGMEEIMFYSNLAEFKENMSTIVGPKVAELCSGLQTYLLSNTPETLTHEEIESGYGKEIIHNRKKRSVFSRRVRRANRPYGQTQAQYVGFSESSRSSLKASATIHGSESVIDGGYGMGQVQSQLFPCVGNCHTNGKQTASMSFPAAYSNGYKSSSDRGYIKNGNGLTNGKGRTSGAAENVVLSSIDSKKPYLSGSSGNSQLTPQASYGNGQSIPQASYGNGQLTPQASYGNGQSIPQASYGNGQSIPQASYGNGQSVPQTSYGNGQSIPQTSYGNGQSVPQTSYGNGQSVPQTSHGNGQLTPQASYGNGQSIPQASYGNGQSIPQASYRNGQSIPQTSHGNGQLTPHVSYGNGQLTPHTSYGNGQLTPHAAYGNGQLTLQGTPGNGLYQNGKHDDAIPSTPTDSQYGHNGKYGPPGSLHTDISNGKKNGHGSPQNGHYQGNGKPAGVSELSPGLEHPGSGTVDGSYYPTHQRPSVPSEYSNAENPRQNGGYIVDSSGSTSPGYYAQGDGGGDPNVGGSQSSVAIHNSLDNHQGAVSSMGALDQEIIQSSLQGSIEGTGTFSGQAQSGKGGKLSMAQLMLTQKMGTGSASSSLGEFGKSQSQLKVNYEDGSSMAGSQSIFKTYLSSSQAIGGLNGAQASAHSSGIRGSSSQSQVSMDGKKESPHDWKGRKFIGGGSTSSQTGFHGGNSLSQMQGKFVDGSSYTSSSQSLSSRVQNDMPQGYDSLQIPQLDYNQDLHHQPIKNQGRGPTSFSYPQQPQSEAETGHGRLDREHQQLQSGPHDTLYRPEMINGNAPASNIFKTSSQSGPSPGDPMKHNVVASIPDSRDSEPINAGISGYTSHRYEDQFGYASPHIEDQRGKHDRYTPLVSSHLPIFMDPEIDIPKQDHVDDTKAKTLLPEGYLESLQNGEPNLLKVSDYKINVKPEVVSTFPSQEYVYPASTIQEAIQTESIIKDTGITLEAGDAIPGSPGQIVPKGFRGKLIVEDSASHDTEQKQTPLSPLVPTSGEVHSRDSLESHGFESHGQNIGPGLSTPIEQKVHEYPSSSDIHAGRKPTVGTQVYNDLEDSASPRHFSYKNNGFPNGQNGFITRENHAPASVNNGVATRNNGQAINGYNGLGTNGKNGQAINGYNGLGTNGKNGQTINGYNALGTNGKNGQTINGYNGLGTNGKNGQTINGYNGLGTNGKNGQTINGYNGLGTNGKNGQAINGYNGLVANGKHGPEIDGNIGLGVNGNDGLSEKATKRNNGGVTNNGVEFSHSYYSSASPCGYFSFSCNVVFKPNKKVKVCKPLPIELTCCCT